VVENGLTDIDVGVLRHLEEIDKPVGMEALAIIANTTRETFGLLIEPFIIQQGYMTRTARGRLITEKGKTLLLNLKEAVNHVPVR
jgi:Holliday junction resolvasome RuvABC ATP-dependent DNA helicase subunit